MRLNLRETLTRPVRKRDVRIKTSSSPLSSPKKSPTVGKSTTHRAARIKDPKLQSREFSRFGYSTAKVKKIIVYETVKDSAPVNPNHTYLPEDMSPEERRNLIRFGPGTDVQRERKVAINLLRKYKPIINLNKYKQVAANLDIEAQGHDRSMRKRRMATETFDNPMLKEKMRVRSVSRK